VSGGHRTLADQRGWADGKGTRLLIAQSASKSLAGSSPPIERASRVPIGALFGTMG
jgi:hypothetical protein